MGQYNFKKDLALAEKNQAMVANKYKELGLIDRFEMSPAKLFPEYDATFFKGERKKTVECKEDFKHKETGNLFIETHRKFPDESTEPSDLGLTQADTHIFTIHFKDNTVGIYEITTKRLKKILNNNPELPERGTTDNPAFSSKGKLLPFADFKEQFTHIYTYNITTPPSTDMKTPPVNKILNGECSAVLSKFPDACIDLVVTSPPYDNLRDYKGFNFEPEPIIKQLYRTMKDGGVIVWVVGDEVAKGSETGNSFKQALAFINAGFNLHDTMLYEKNGSSFPARREGSRYSQIFEYMFIFSKGKPKTAKLICDKKNRWIGWVNWGKKVDRMVDGRLVQNSDIAPIPEFSPRNNIWKYNTGNVYSASDKLAKQHPAIFPEALAKDHIITWSNKGDVVVDIMCGSGTTCKMAKALGRNYIGIDMSQEYCELAEKRVKLAEPMSDEVVINKEEIKNVKMVIDGKELSYEFPESDLEAFMFAVKEFNRIKPKLKKLEEKLVH